MTNWRDWNIFGKYWYFRVPMLVVLVIACTAMWLRPHAQFEDPEVAQRTVYYVLLPVIGLLAIALVERDPRAAACDSLAMLFAIWSYMHSWEDAMLIRRLNESPAEWENRALMAKVVYAHWLSLPAILGIVLVWTPSSIAFRAVAATVVLFMTTAAAGIRPTVWMEPIVFGISLFTAILVATIFRFLNGPLTCSKDEPRTERTWRGRTVDVLCVIIALGYAGFVFFRREPYPSWSDVSAGLVDSVHIALVVAAASIVLSPATLRSFLLGAFFVGSIAVLGWKNDWLASHLPYLVEADNNYTPGFLENISATWRPWTAVGATVLPVLAWRLHTYSWKSGDDNSTSDTPSVTDEHGTKVIP